MIYSEPKPHKRLWEMEIIPNNFFSDKIKCGRRYWKYSLAIKIYEFLGHFSHPGGSDSKESACNAGDLGSIPGSGRSPGEGMATCSGILVWRMPWTDKPGGLQFMGLQTVRHDWAANTHTHTSTEKSVLPWQIQDKRLLFFMISATCRAVNTGNRFKKIYKCIIKT